MMGIPIHSEAPHRIGWITHRCPSLGAILNRAIVFVIELVQEKRSTEAHHPTLHFSLSGSYSGDLVTFFIVAVFNLIYPSMMRFLHRKDQIDAVRAEGRDDCVAEGEEKRILGATAGWSRQWRGNVDPLQAIRDTVHHDSFAGECIVAHVRWPPNGQCHSLDPIVSADSVPNVDGLVESRWYSGQGLRRFVAFVVVVVAASREFVSAFAASVSVVFVVSVHLWPRQIDENHRQSHTSTKSLDILDTTGVRRVLFGQHRNRHRPYLGVVSHDSRVEWLGPGWKREDPGIVVAYLLVQVVVLMVAYRCWSISRGDSGGRHYCKNRTRVAGVATYEESESCPHSKVFERTETIGDSTIVVV